jgi:hypothetical protein
MHIHKVCYLYPQHSVSNNEEAVDISKHGIDQLSRNYIPPATQLPD